MKPANRFIDMKIIIAVPSHEEKDRMDIQNSNLAILMPSCAILGSRGGALRDSTDDHQSTVIKSVCHAAHTSHPRNIKLPDLLRIGRYQKAPELGPSILFFSGGSALRQVSRAQELSHNSIHLVTPFDSGGSSAKLRKAFDMPAIGICAAA